MPVESDVLFHPRINKAVAVLRQYGRPSLVGSVALKAWRGETPFHTPRSRRKPGTTVAEHQDGHPRIVVTDNAFCGGNNILLQGQQCADSIGQYSFEAGIVTTATFEKMFLTFNARPPLLPRRRSRCHDDSLRFQSSAVCASRLSSSWGNATSSWNQRS